MALRQQPDRLKVPCRAGVGTASIPFLQLNNAQMIGHMCHGSPSAIHGTSIYRLRSILGIPAESITRNPYEYCNPCIGCALIWPIGHVCEGAKMTAAARKTMGSDTVAAIAL